MFIGIPARARARAQRAQLLLVRRMESGLEARMYRLMKRMGDEVAAAVKSRTSYDAVVSKYQKPMQELLVKYYKAVGAKVQPMIEADINKLLNAKKSLMADAFWREFNMWSNNQAAREIVMLGATTKLKIGKLITRELAQGASYADVAKTLRDKFPAFSKVRAKRIARTEMHTALVQSTDTSVKATKIKMEKEWSATLDERTREAHKQIDGTRIPMEQAFSVGGEPMMRPGDPSGKAKNVINCRCVLLYHPVRN